MVSFTHRGRIMTTSSDDWEREPWARLMRAGVRVSILVHGHGADGLGRMLEQLRGIPPEEWAFWTARFEAALSRAGYGGRDDVDPTRDGGGRIGQKAQGAAIFGGFSGFSPV
jgi:hypothetical protein